MTTCQQAVNFRCSKRSNIVDRVIMRLASKQEFFSCIIWIQCTQATLICSLCVVAIIERMTVSLQIVVSSQIVFLIFCHQENILAGPVSVLSLCSPRPHCEWMGDAENVLKKRKVHAWRKMKLGRLNFRVNLSQNWRLWNFIILGQGHKRG